MSPTSTLLSFPSTMAESSSLLFHLFLFSLLFPFSLSRSFSSSHLEFQDLDVTGSIHSTVTALSPRSQQFSEDLTSSSYSTLSLQLHPRISLPTHITHKDYESLTQSRLARDSARVDAILTKAHLAVHGISAAEMRPVEAELTAENLEVPVSSGTSQGSGEYFSRVGLGSPSKQYYMVVDTGSDVTWVQCRPCSDCYQQSDPVFNPSESHTYSTVPCASPQCHALELSQCSANNLCRYQVSYGDGSYTTGDFVTETLSFGPSGSIPKLALGCGHDNEGLFVGAAGLLGLGAGPLSLTSQIKAASFSYCLVDRDSSKSSTLDFNSAPPAGSVTAPLLKNGRVGTFYYVGLNGLSVGGTPVSIPPGLFSVDESGAGGVIVDSGTAVTRLPTEAYNTLRDSFVKLTQHLKSTSGVALFDTCYDLASMSSVKVPTVSFQFTGGKSLDLPAKNYLIPVDSSGTFCFAFAPTTSSMGIIGNVQQQGTRVHFDMEKSLVAFTPNNC